MPTVPDIHRRGTRAAQGTLAAPPLTVGTLYFVTDESVTERWNGTAWETYSGPSGTGSYAPLVHATRHQAGGADPIALDTLAAPTDITALNATAAQHGLLRKLSGTATQYLDGSGAWSTPASTPPVVRRQVTVLLDGGAAPITTGVKAYLSLPLAGTWKKWRLLSVDPAATVGSIVIDVWKDTYANYPPTVADTITAAAKPTLTAANKAESTTLTGWTTTFAAGDVLGLSVDSAATVTRIALTLEFE